MKENGRLFLVGCPRSGTTLLQCLLAAHPLIASFPESHFFTHLVPGQRWRRMLGQAKEGIDGRYLEYLEKLERLDLRQRIPQGKKKAAPYARSFTRILDELTEAQGKEIWLEKTPVHLLYIKHIQKLVPGARFIHIVRSGEDVVASLYEVTHKHPEVWGGSRNLEECVTRWLGDLRTSARYRSRPDHIVVRYEKLVAEPKEVLEDVCRFAEVEFDAQMLADYSGEAERLVLKAETWKTGAGGAIKSANAGKFHKLFDEEQRQYVRRRLAGVKLEELFPHY